MQKAQRKRLEDTRRRGDKGGELEHRAEVCSPVSTSRIWNVVPDVLAPNKQQPFICPETPGSPLSQRLELVSSTDGENLAKRTNKHECVFLDLFIAGCYDRRGNTKC